MDTENLHNKEAIEKLLELVNKIDIGMLCTYPENDAYLHAVAMSRWEEKLRYDQVPENQVIGTK